MTFITVTSNTKLFVDAHRRLIPREIDLATAQALTFTGERVKKGEIAEMKRVFDRPTSYTLNSLFLKSATPQKLSARVWVKDSGSTGRGGVAPEKYLLPEVEGGQRRHKGYEKALISFGLMPSDMYAVPGQRARIDRFGNISRGQIMQILSALRAAERTAGYSANRTEASKRRNRGKQQDYFVGRPSNGRGPLGVWQRVGQGARPILIFVKAPTYRVRFRFHHVADEIVKREFEPLLKARFDSVLRKRKF